MNLAKEIYNIESEATNFEYLSNTDKRNEITNESIDIF